MIKVLFISSWFPNRVTPYNGDFVERHALAVSEVCKASVLHVIPDPDLRGRFMEIVEIQKGLLFEAIIYIRKSKSRVGLVNRLSNRILYGLGYLLGYLIIKREMGTPNIIHANVIVPVSKVALWINRFTGIPYIISEHWTAYLTEDGRKLAAGYARPVSKSFALVPVTENLKQALISFGYGSVRYFIVPNVVDTEIFRPLPRNTGSHKKILHVSSMKDEHKNIRGIISALKMLRSIRNDFVFAFVGNATTQQKEMVNQAGLNDFVTFAGEVEHSEVAGLMAQSDILVLFSNVENLPCVIPEALACGIPVISTKVGGIAEWIDRRHGILIERGNEKELFEAMNCLLDHSDEYDREDLHAYAVKNFSIPVIGKQFLEIYNLALKST